jgi:hypothetical protein
MLARTSSIQGRCDECLVSRADEAARRVQLYLIFLQAVLEYILNHETASLTQGNFMPHTTQCFVDVFHDLRWGFCPSQLEELLPHMAGIAMDNRLRNSPEELVYHDRFIVLWDRIEGFLDDVTAERIHRKIQSITTNGLSDLDDLLRRAMFKAPLNEEVPEAVDHQRISLG